MKSEKVLVLMNDEVEPDGVVVTSDIRVFAYDALDGELKEIPTLDWDQLPDEPAEHWANILDEK